MLGGAVDFASTLVLLGFLCESLVQYILSPFKKLDPYLHYFAMTLGVFLCIAFRVNLIVEVITTVPNTPLAYWTGIVLTGLVVGRGSNFAHDLWEKYVLPKKPE